jgi:hypothetical protein
MTNHPLDDEIRELADQLRSAPDDVLDLAADVATRYRRERLIALGLAAVDSLIQDDEREIDENDPRLVAVRERFRDRLRGLLDWARAQGRL